MNGVNLDDFTPAERGWYLELTGRLAPAVPATQQELADALVVFGYASLESIPVGPCAHHIVTRRGPVVVHRSRTAERKAAVSKQDGVTQPLLSEAMCAALLAQFDPTPMADE